MHTQDDYIRGILNSSKTIAVVGASNNPTRASYQVSEYLMDHQYTVWLVNPTVDTIMGQPVYKSLLDLPAEPDIVDVFRRPEDLPPVLADAIACRAKTLWLQLGIFDEDIESQARAAGLNVVSNRCIKVDHAALVG